MRTTKSNDPYVAPGISPKKYSYHRDEFGGNDRIDGGAGNDELRGGGGNDSISGAAGNDTIEGGEGNDILDGGSGQDFLDERVGQSVHFIGDEDILIPPKIDPANVQFSGGSLVHKSRDASGAAKTEMDTLKGIETAQLTGTSGNDRIDASKFKGSVTLNGGNGDDVLIGGRGDDVLDGGDGNDVLRGRRGNDTLTGGAGNDTLNGGKGMDRVRETGLTNAQATSGSLNSNLGRDVLVRMNELDLSGTSGNDNLDARRFHGSVTLSGGDGDDWLIGTRFCDNLNGGNGRDVIRGRGNRDTINTSDSEADVVLSERRSLQNDHSQRTSDAKDRVLTRNLWRGNAQVSDAVFSGNLEKLWKAIG